MISTEGKSLRIRRINSSPFMPGMFRSRNSRSAEGFSSTTACSVSRLSASRMRASSTQFSIA